MTTKSTKPELGELTPGQKVMVRRSYNDSRNRKPEDLYIPATIVKAARVWIEIRASEGSRTWRMRRDTQDERSQYSGNDHRFLTMEQYDWEVTRTWARGVLQEYGIDLRSDSLLKGSEVKLAELISRSAELTTLQSRQ